MARHFLLFRFPFGTAHGMRTGTDTILLRLAYKGINGYGEVALPPYVDERPEDVVKDIYCIDIQHYKNIELELNNEAWHRDGQFQTKAGRLLWNSAYIDLMSKLLGQSTSSFMRVRSPQAATTCTLATIGLGDVRSIPSKLEALPECGAIKVKIEARGWQDTLTAVLKATDKPLFLDANQGLGEVAVVQAILEWTGEDRVIGIEQPFERNDLDRHHALGLCTEVPVYADESIQDLEDLEARGWAFGGLNVKLAKCGGLDHAAGMIERARANGKRVMLGCMSEGSLGCASMASLQSYADIVDLDGPWLVANDLFEGLEMGPSGIRVMHKSGHGVVPKADIAWTPIGA